MAERVSPNAWWSTLKSIAGPELGEHVPGRKVPKDKPMAADKASDKAKVDQKWFGGTPTKAAKKADTKVVKAELFVEDNGVRGIKRAPGRKATATASHKMQAITNICNLYHRGLVRADAAVSVINEIAR